MMSLIFGPLLGRTMESYIDMLVKSKSRVNHIAHLRDAFRLMRLHRSLLNPDKCAFRVGYGNFLGFLVSQRGIEMSLDQVKAIKQMQPPATKKQIQTLTRKLAALNKCISRYSDHLRPFFTTLKGASSNVTRPFTLSRSTSSPLYLCLKQMMARSSTSICLPRLWP